MNPLEWLGKQDDKYSAAIRESFTPPNDPNIIDTTRAGAHSFLGVPRELPSKIREGYNNPGGKFVHNAGMASRYALPGLGVTAAGIALADLAGYFGGSPDQPEQGQLGLNNGEMSALGIIAAAPLLAGGAAAGMSMFGGNEDIEQAAAQGLADAGRQQEELDAAYGRSNEAANNKRIAEQVKKRHRPGRAAGKGVAF